MVASDTPCAARACPSALVSAPAWRRIGALLALLLATAAAQPQHSHGGTKARAQLASGAAFAPDGSLWLTGLNEDGQLFVQSAPATDLQRWGARRVVNTAGDAISADGEAFPKLAFGPKGWVVITYTQPLAKPYTGMIRMLRSDDGGHSFSAPFTVHADRQQITHRFESTAFDARGVLHTLWIDKRDMERAPRTGKKSSYQGAAVYRNESRDGGASFGPDLKLADHSCECCRIAMAPGSDGMLRAMWRHVFETDVRDHGFAALLAPDEVRLVRASFDDWRIDACPHHGPGLAPAPDEGFHAVWFGVRRSAGEEVAGVRYARLRPDGSPQADTLRLLPDPAAEHADVLASGTRVAIVWRSVQGPTSTLKAWLSADSGRSFALRVLGHVSGDNDQPRLAQRGERMVAVWRNPKETQVHEIRF